LTTINGAFYDETVFTPIYLGVAQARGTGE